MNTYAEVLAAAKINMGPLCKVCPDCNGIACRGRIPGPGGKGLGLGFIRNVEDLRQVSLNMDTLYEAKVIDTSFNFFGRSLTMPVMAAPIGGVNLHYGDKHDDLSYSEAVIEGCKMAGTIGFTGDGVKDEVYRGAVKAIERAKGCGVATIKPWHIEEVIEKGLLAKAAGAPAFAMDVDAAGLSILAAQGKSVSPLSREALKRIQTAVDLPLIVKGIMTAQGAMKAREAGAAGIVISNHGGRVLDETPSGISRLEAIKLAVGSEMMVLVDGGFRSGIDVFKAIALGADAVLIGRPVAIAVYGGDAQGVKLYMEKIRAELADAMLMTGAGNIDSIARHMVNEPF